MTRKEMRAEINRLRKENAELHDQVACLKSTQFQPFPVSVPSMPLLPVQPFPYPNYVPNYPIVPQSIIW